jgi:hypothetical protein
MNKTIKANFEGQEICLETVSEPASPKTLYWSRAPGDFVNKYTRVNPFGTTQGRGSLSFEGTIREWYETLAETILDAHNHIHRRQCRSPNRIEASPEILTMLRHTIGFKETSQTDGVLFGFINIKSNPNIPNDELRMFLFSDQRITLIDNQETNIPEAFVTKCDSVQLVDQMTVRVLNMNVI